jgi:hypothetical protein
MIKVHNEDWLDEDQKEALRMVNKYKKARAIFEDELRRGWDEHSALREVYDWCLFEGYKNGIKDFRP